MRRLLFDVAISVVVVGALAIAMVRTYAPPPAFSTADELSVRERFPGGRVADDGSWRTCERAMEVRRYPDGRELMFPDRRCWR